MRRVLWTLALGALSCGPGEPMTSNRPHGMPPATWLTAEGNQAMGGRSVTLKDTAIGGGKRAYGPETRQPLVNIMARDPGDAQVLNVTAQLLRITGNNPFNADVLITAEWGVDGGQQIAYMKLGNGLQFSVPGNYLRVIAQNLLNEVNVSGSAAIGGWGPSDPHYSWSTITTLPGPIIISRLIDYFAPSSPTPPILTQQNTTPAPYIIPPYARRFTLVVNGATPGATYIVDQASAFGGVILREDTLVAPANGIVVFDNIPLLTETAQIQLETADAVTPTLALDFELDL